MFRHSRSRSPDPLYARTAPRKGFYSTRTLYPHRLERAAPQTAAVRKWGAKLDLFHEPPALKLAGGAGNRADLVLDFGTELEGVLEMTVRASNPCTLVVSFGESVGEVEKWGLETRVWDCPPTSEEWFVEKKGSARRAFQARGFRYIRILAHDLEEPLEIRKIGIKARFAFGKRAGDLECADKAMQEVWQSSVYTARLCTREEAYWDGIKRDRHGWYGDARITQMTTDLTFFEPGPAEAMLLQLQTGRWANAIPGYSFDAIAMLRQLILTYGTDRPAVKEIYKRMRALLAWAKRTQTNAQGFLVHNKKVDYFFGLGFLDWSAMPLGGRFEQLSWLQCKYVEALHNAADIAGWLGKKSDAAGWHKHAEILAGHAVKLFFSKSKGFIHTLAQAQRKWEKLTPQRHYQLSYEEKQSIGPSGSTRHAATLAAWAGLCDTPVARRAVLRTLDSDKQPPLISPYFTYYELEARARCGDPAGAIRRMRDYLHPMSTRYDCATIWETFEPWITGFQALSLNAWPKSFCHGWSSGIVPLAAKWMLGVEPVAPGYGLIRLRPDSGLPWIFAATIPTPHGAIRIRRAKRGGTLTYTVPKAIRIEPTDTSSMTIRHV